MRSISKIVSDGLGHMTQISQPSFPFSWLDPAGILEQTKKKSFLHNSEMSTAVSTRISHQFTNLEQSSTCEANIFESANGYETGRQKKKQPTYSQSKYLNVQSTSSIFYHMQIKPNFFKYTFIVETFT